MDNKIILIIVIIISLLLLIIELIVSNKNKPIIKPSKMSRDEAKEFLRQKLALYKLDTFLNVIFELIESDKAMSIDDIIVVKDTILNFVDENVDIFRNEKRNLKYEEIIKAFIILCDYNSKENVIIMDRTDPLDIIVRCEYSNSRYYQKKKVATNSYFELVYILKKREKEIIEMLGVTLTELTVFFNSFRESVYKMMIRRSDKYILKLEDFSNLKKSKIEDIVKLLSNENNVKLYMYDDFLIATDYYFFIDNFYELIEEKLSIYPMINKIRKDRGIYLENQVYKMLNRNPGICYKNYDMDGLEVDVLYIIDDLILLIETKSLLYTSYNFEETESRKNMQKYVKKAIEQLDKRICLINNKENLEINNRIFKGHYNILPLIIMSNDIYGIANTTYEEAKELGYIANPLVLSYDDFAYMFNSNVDIRDTIKYLMKRTIEKQNNIHIGDEFALFFYYFNKTNIDSFSLRNALAFDNLMSIVEPKHVKNSIILTFVDNTLKKCKNKEYRDVFSYISEQILQCGNLEAVFKRRYFHIHYNVYLHYEPELYIPHEIGYHFFFDLEYNYKSTTKKIDSCSFEKILRNNI